MLFLTHYASPLGPILLAADETGLTGLWFEAQKYFPSFSGVEYQEKETPVLTETVRWLDVYFSGKDPGFLPPLHPQGSPFRQTVWDILLTIPRGQTITYGELPDDWAFAARRPWAARWGTIPYPSSSPATGWWEATAV